MIAPFARSSLSKDEVEAGISDWKMCQVQRHVFEVFV